MKEIEKYVTHNAINKLNIADIKDSVASVCAIIPDKNTVKRLMDDPENKNWDECVTYDMIIYHKKSDKYDSKLEFNHDNNNLTYLRCCCFLLDEIRYMINNIINDESNISHCSKKYYRASLQYFERIAFSDNDDRDNPYYYVKNIMEQKGYELYLFKNKDYCELTIKINDKRERE